MTSSQRQRLKGEGVVMQAAVSLAMSALLFQPIAEQGMYSMDASGKLSKGSFNNRACSSAASSTKSGSRNFFTSFSVNTRIPIFI